MLNAESVLFFLEKFLFTGLLEDDVVCFSDTTLKAESVLFFLENDRFSVLGGVDPSNVLVVMVKVFIQLPSSDVVGETSAPSNVLVETVKVLTCARGCVGSGDTASFTMSS
jgi:hypothetical protein